MGFRSILYLLIYLHSYTNYQQNLAQIIRFYWSEMSEDNIYKTKSRLVNLEFLKIWIF